MKLFNKPLKLSVLQLRLSKIALHMIILGWLTVTFYAGVTDNLGADPVKALIHFTGIGALNLLLITLIISPAARYLPAPVLIRFRRLLGVYVFVFAAVHLLFYLSFELQFDWSLVIGEIVKRPYITVGMVALLLLLALTVTSPNIIRQKLGKRWQPLHNSIYLVVFLALLHYSWSRKTALQEPLIYWFIAFLVLLPRLQKLKQLFKRT